MQTIYLEKGCPSDLPASVATIGFFDGVHLGHQFLVAHVVQTARDAGLKSMVVTFDKHPREVLQSSYQPQMLTTLPERLALLERTGVDIVAVLHFDVALSQLTAHAFMHDLLRQKLHVVKLFIGYDHRFGHNRTEGFSDYVRYGREMGMEVVQNPAFDVQGEHVSSTLCRRLVASGEMASATRCLGYPYLLEGKVVSGFQQGRKMGFPTANIQLDDTRRIVPAPGVYAVRVCIGSHAEEPLPSDSTWRLGMMNIGFRPTFEGHRLTLEVNLFDFAGDLYGQTLQVAFLKRIREERKFSSPDALAEQLRKDKQAILAIESK